MSDLSELFARDPRSYTKEGKELETIVAAMRERRHQFNAGGRKKAKKATTTVKDQEMLSLVDSLDIKL